MSGWTPQPQIDNYGPGVIDVNAEWSGVLEAPVGATVCRYGQRTSPDNDGIPGSDRDGVEGADCGTVHAKNETLLGGTASELNGLTIASNVCSEDGDSGGTFVTPSGEVQGTLTGGDECPEPVDSDPAEPNPVAISYFQPVATTLDRFDKIMLTTHGANAPTINGLDCMEMGQIFLCGISNYESQGETDILWTSGLQSGTGPSFSGNCPQWGGGGPISVSLSVTNPYGTTQETEYVDCPAGP